MLISGGGGGGGGGGAPCRCDAGVAVLECRLLISTESLLGAGDGVGLLYRCEGNWGAWVGVFGEESWALEGDDSVSIGSGPLRLRCEDERRLECRDSERSFSSVRWAALTYVAWLDVPDLRLILDPSSAREADLDKPEDLDFDRTGSSSLSLSVVLFMPVKSVSGGVGGRWSLTGSCGVSDRSAAGEADLRRSDSADLSRGLSVDESAGSGVFILEPCKLPRSSRLATASLLCALLKVGYANDVRSRSIVEWLMPAVKSLIESARSFSPSPSLCRR
jgi:hypothetical protein